MTDLFKQLGGALGDFKMKNIDSDSLHEIIGEFAPLIGVATDGTNGRKIPKTEPVELETPPILTEQTNEQADLSHNSSAAQYDNNIEIKQEPESSSDSSALDLSVNAEKKTQSNKRKLETENAVILQGMAKSNLIIDQTVYKKSKHSLDVTVKNENVLSTNPNNVQYAAKNCQNTEEGSEDSKSNRHLYEIKTVYNLKYYQCKLCSKVYDTKYLINRHLITHGNNRPFACEQCGKSFSQKCDLNRHMNVHNEARQHSCSVCGKLFKRSDYLAKHERQYCGVLKPHKCQKCHKGFEEPNQLLDHTCSGRNDGSSFDCEHCPESFTSVDALVEHRKCHLKTEVEYKCTRCQETFGEFIAYVEHFKVSFILLSQYFRLFLFQKLEKVPGSIFWGKFISVLQEKEKQTTVTISCFFFGGGVELLSFMIL